MMEIIGVVIFVVLIVGIIFKFRHGGLTEAERKCKVHKKEQCLRAGTTICEYPNCELIKALEEESNK